MDAIAAVPRDGAVRPDGGSGRCPACGEGDLILTRVVRRAGEPGRAAYCAGSYDGRRRRVVRRSCGWAGAAPERGDA